MQVMRTYVANCEEPVRQMTVRGLTTQHKPETLPISPYAQNTPNLNCLDLSLFTQTGCDAVEAVKAGSILLGKIRAPIVPLQELVKADVFSEQLSNCLDFKRCSSYLSLPVRLLSHLISGVCMRKHHLLLDDAIYSQYVSAMHI